MLNRPEYIIIHCSASLWGGATQINAWHKARGFLKIGYHFVILNGWLTKRLNSKAFDGHIESGRMLGEVGAHCIGYNTKSIGICLIGLENFTDSQMSSLQDVCQEMMEMYHISMDKVIGHCDTESGKQEGKTCPNFDVAAFREKYLLKVT